MQKVLATILIPAVLAVGSPARAEATSAALPAMTPERIRQAIKWGESAPEKELEQYTLGSERTWIVNFDTPFLRVAQLARAMKIQNQPLGEEDIPPKVVAQEVHLYAHARLSVAGTSARDLPNIEYVAIAKPNPNGPSESILPSSLQSFVRRVPNDGSYDGPARLARSVKAIFPLSALVPGNEVRIVFEGGTVQTVKVTAQVLARAR